MICQERIFPRTLTIYQRRKDVIDLTMKTEREEFEGCGLELPDLVGLSVPNLKFNVAFYYDFLEAGLIFQTFSDVL